LKLNVDAIHLITTDNNNNNSNKNNDQTIDYSISINMSEEEATSKQAVPAIVESSENAATPVENKK
jgi:hypothetical protein